MDKSIVKGISHIAIAVESLEDVKNWLALFSSEITARYTSKKQGVNALVINTNFCDIEFLEPLNNTSSISSFLKKNPKGGLHHICFFVEDLGSGLVSLKQKGVRNITRDNINGILHNSPVAFLNPKDLNNVLVEFEQMPKEVITKI